MATATNHEKRASADHASVFSSPEALHEILDEFFADLPSRDELAASTPPTSPPPVAPQRQQARARALQFANEPSHRTRVTADDDVNSGWFYRVKQTICVGLMLLGAVMFYRGMPASWRPAVNPFGDAPAATANSTPAPSTSGERGLRTKRIDDARVGDRLIGRNPIREQADLVEPDPATWRKVSLHMTKESGLGLWIDLLRPVTWIEEHNAEVGGTISIDLYEMGAVGDAEVTHLGPCPKIQPGTGTVVTGTFKHQADKNTNVVHLKLEDQIELTGVTDNHPYWSADRQEFVDAGKLREGELVDTEYGLKHVISVTPIKYSEFLYNLETTEHVYRVGSLGTLVHNACAIELRKALNRAGVYGDPGTVPHHLVSRFDTRADSARSILSKHGIDLDSHWNGAFLPTRGSSARGAIHNNLHTNAFYETVTARLRKADAGGRAHVLRELQKIRSELLDGTFPSLQNRNINF